MREAGADRREGPLSSHSEGLRCLNLILHFPSSTAITLVTSTNFEPSLVTLQYKKSATLPLIVVALRPPGSTHAHNTIESHLRSAACTTRLRDSCIHPLLDLSWFPNYAHVAYRDVHAYIARGQAETTR